MKHSELPRGVFHPEDEWKQKRLDKAVQDLLYELQLKKKREILEMIRNHSPIK